MGVRKYGCLLVVLSTFLCEAPFDLSWLSSGFKFMAEVPDFAESCLLMSLKTLQSEEQKEAPAKRRWSITWPVV